MNSSILKSRAEQVYDAIYEEEDARVCRDISDAACTHVPHNFFLNAAAVALGKTADAVANAKTTLPWLLSAVGAPGWTIMMLVPIRESGSMLPQLAIGSWVRQAPLRKWFYVAGAIVQAFALLGLCLSFVLLQGTAAGFGVLIGVIFFSLARGFCSVAAKDVTGKTVPKTRRGRVNGLSSSIAGAGTLLAVWLLYQLNAGFIAYVGLIALAALLWFGAAFLYAQIDEEPGVSEGGVNGLAAALAGLSLLRDDIPFRRFVVARALLIGTSLTAPLIVMMAQQRSDADLLFFLLAQGFAALLSGHIWGKFADQSSRLVLFSAGVAAGFLGLMISLTDIYSAGLTRTQWFLPVCFFVLMLLHDGVRAGRKTYLVDLGGADKRTDYVAVSNTLIGAILLGAGALAALVESFGTITAILFFSLLAFVAAPFIYALPEVQIEGVINATDGRPS
jgi:hypothetical protein